MRKGIMSKPLDVAYQNIGQKEKGQVVRDELSVVRH
jgi:hypothetical protein